MDLVAAGRHCAGSAADCAFFIAATLCGDVDDPGESELAACVNALPSTTCTGPTDYCPDGCAELPSACATLY